MHILFVTATYPPSVNGVAIAVSNLKKELSRMGHTVTVLAPDNPKAKKEKGVIRYAALNNPFIKDYPIPLFPGVRSIYKLIGREKPDMVHTHHAFHVGFFAKVIADRFKVPLVFTFHTDIEGTTEKYMDFLPKGVRDSFLKTGIYEYLKKIDLAVCPSEFLLQEVAQKAPRLKTVCIPTGIPQFKRLHLSKRLLRRKLKLPQNQTILLNVSRLGPEKNVSLSIHAIKYLPEDYVLLLVGDGPDKEELKKLAKRLKVQRRVFFAGRVAYGAIPQFYQAADVFLYSSTVDTQGLVFLEAAYFGLPIVAVRGIASSEWVKPELGILTNPKAKDMASALMGIDNKTYASMSKMGESFAAKYTISSTAKRLLAAYNKALKNFKAI